MATGVPNRRRTKDASDPEFHLSYPGKRSVPEILATPATNVTEIWRGNSAANVNRLYFAENIGVLSMLRSDPGVARSVRLIYIDPPFATQSAFHTRSQSPAYDDGLSGAEFVEYLRQRLVLLRELLASDGSIYLHLDNKMVFQMKIVMDEVFGPANFRNCITRKKCNPKNYTRKQFGNIADFILLYSKTDQWVWNSPVEPWTSERAREYQYVEKESGRRYMKVPVHAPGVRNGETGDPWRGVLPPPGKHWQYPPRVLDEMDARGEIFWSSSGNPRRKVYLDESPGVGVQDIWLDFKDAHNQNVKITGYPTEKNPDLLKRIILASSNPRDIVLDSFSGSGTTLAMAAELGRRWIGIDSSPEAIATTLRRFTSGLERMGDFIPSRPAMQRMLVEIPTPPRPKQMTLGLDFDECIPATVAASANPVSDFSLIAETGRENAANELVAEWEEQSPSLAMTDNV
jgi:adenine-specific DNA-methyltransferase